MTHSGKDVKLLIDGQEVQGFSPEDSTVTMKATSHIVYAIWDNELQELHQFAASPNELAKDVVNAYLAKAFSDSAYEEVSKDILTLVSGATSIEDLTEKLFGMGFHLNILAI